jgi:hypothetical protein
MIQELKKTSEHFKMNLKSGKDQKTPRNFSMRHLENKNLSETDNLLSDLWTGLSLILEWIKILKFKKA